MTLDERYTVPYIEREASLIIQVFSPHKKREWVKYRPTEKDRRILANIMRHK